MRIAVSLLIFFIALTACSPASPSPVAEALPTVSPQPSATATLPPSPTYTPTITQTATPTATPQPTVDPVIAARIDAIRLAVGDQVEDWLTYHDQVEKFGLPYDMYELTVVYAGEDPSAAGRVLLNGNGEPVGEVITGFTGHILIGDELRTITFAYWFKNYGNGLCRAMAGYANEFDCEKLVEKYLPAEKTVEKKGKGEWNAVPGQVISMYLYPPDGTTVNYNEFSIRFWSGQEDLYTALVEEGDTSIGTIVPAWARLYCNADNKVLVPNQCYEPEDAIIIPGYESPAG